ncbi:MAG: DUF3696 domain-containing protein [Candidatus Dadabacteria bacterium]|nr:DUF3696 domain-containing protein [Candidatus Dadabacteria bacterium]MDE0476834.1 DUF3696 domain-containing protein [Candidatus Dadabacteria bacterium]
MRLRRIEIENFKGIGKRQAIDLKPITLLFGPNNAGKSTILQVLHYMRELLERQNPDPDQTIAGGLIDLGGFRALVHNHELNRAITIKLVIDLSEDLGNDRLPLNSGIHLGDTEFANLDILYIFGGDTDFNKHAVVQELGVMVEVCWSDLLMGPYVSLLSLDMNGIQILSIKSPPQKGRAIITDFNFEHPLLQRIIYQDDIVEDDELYQGDLPGHIDEGDPFSSPLGAEIWELSRDMAKGTPTFAEDNFRVTVSTPMGALPNPNKPLDLELRDPEVDKPELEQSTSRVRGLATLLDELVLGPVRVANDYLSGMTYIGPLREIPTRNFRPRLSPDESRWARGLAAWDLLYSDVKGDLVDAVNQWLGDEAKLRTGYQLERVVFREIPVPSRLSFLFERGLTEDDLGELQELYENLETRVEVALRDFEKDILVAPDDIGVGISQMIPVVVGCLTDSVNFLAVEQPELHIHPALQVAMGDLLIRSAFSNKSDFLSAKSLLVETHSEHIMLRLLRRIRETFEGELAPGTPSLTPDAVSVIYVEAGEDCVKFYSLRIDEEGEFVDRWPRGFFDERVEELF